jgi:ABC-2 type transport system permease protein
MKSLGQVVVVMLRLYARDRVSLALSLVLTAFMMVLFGAVGGADQVRLAVSVSASGPAGEGVVDILRGDGWVEVRRVAGEEEVVRDVRSGRAVLGLVLRPGFERGREGRGPREGMELVLGDQPSRWAVFARERVERALFPGQAPGWDLPARTLAATKSRHIDYIFPGVLAMIIMQASLGGGHFLLDARKRGILRRLRLLPFEPARLLAGYLLARLLVVFLNVGLLALIAKLVFDAGVLGSWADLLGAVLLGSAVFLTLGVVLAFLAPSAEGGNLLVQTLGLAMSFLCGVFFSIEQIPAFLRWIPQALPLTYLVDAFRGIANGGLPLAAFRTDIAALLGWLLGTLLLAGAAYRASLLRHE